MSVNTKRLAFIIPFRRGCDASLKEVVSALRTVSDARSIVISVITAGDIYDASQLGSDAVLLENIVSIRLNNSDA